MGFQLAFETKGNGFDRAMSEVFVWSYGCRRRCKDRRTGHYMGNVPGPLSCMWREFQPYADGVEQAHRAHARAVDNRCGSSVYWMWLQPAHTVDRRQVSGVRVVDQRVA